MTAPSDETVSPAPAEPSPARVQPAVPDERVIDAPTRPTLIILGAISLATLVMWGAGRAACNYHVPGESLTPRAVSLDERTANPKDLAIEFGQRVYQGDFATARLLAADQGLAFVEAESASCPGECAARKNGSDSLATLAEVVAGNPVDVYVRVRSVTPSGQRGAHLLEVERKERAWKVTRVLPAGEAVPELKQGPVPGNAPPGSIAAPAADPLAP
ncbi:MAG TPA: hypothetical protein VLC09_17510 [Polyangiaceae bacterium]|nr:hypothetical protein [Polyangiaceae bacterium]